MKKKTLFIIVCVMSLCIGWWYINKQLEYNKSEEAALNFINEYYSQIKAVEMTDRRKLPTGNISISGYINNNEELYFSVTVSEIDYSIDSIGRSENFPPKNEMDED